jgi:hypothetical protein
VPEIKRVFRNVVGPSRLEVDGFFSLDVQSADLDLLTRPAQAVVRASELCRRLSRRLPFLLYIADSLYARSRVSS